MLTPAEIRAMNMAAQDQAITGVHPALHLARAVEAATLATVTPLVREMVEAMIATYPDLNGLAVMSNEALERVNKHANAITAARAFLSGATKESTDHG